MKHTLPDLPYAQNALDPHVSAETLEYHHGKHHKTYVDKLNDMISGSEYESLSLEEIVKKAEGGIFNNAAQHFNHSFYWKCLKPGGGGEPKGALKEAIDKGWGSFSSFKEELTKGATTLFGSGWCWLVKKDDGSLAITQEPNAGTPIRSGGSPILTVDVWEHAYYIDYRNARPKYIEAMWALMNWDFAEENFGK